MNKIFRGYLNKRTGEIIVATNKILASAYFKTDGKKVGYKVRWCDIIRFFKADGNLI